jgi:phage tail-like protein
VEDNIVEQTDIPDSLRFLPAIYHEKGEEEGSPLRAFLMVLDRIFHGIDNTIDHMDRYFDASRTPAGGQEGEADFLTWLASWIALYLDPAWPEQKKRFVLKNAAQLYRYRGTAKALAYVIDLFFDVAVVITEWTWPEGMQVGVRSTIGVDTVLYNRPNLNHVFKITWKIYPPGYSKEELSKRIKKMRDLVDREKPIHTDYFFEIIPVVPLPF